MAIFGLWVRLKEGDDTYSESILQVINKAGGLVYQRNFAGSSSIVVSDWDDPWTCRSFPQMVWLR